MSGVEHPLYAVSLIILIVVLRSWTQLGLATYIVPLQVGASTVAFPRAAAAAMWTWLLSSGVFVVASFIEGGFGGVRAKSVSLTLLALGGLIVALLLGTVCVLTTAITLRTPGMTLDRVPMFTFSMLVGGAIWMLTLPVLFANLLLIWVDHRYGGGTVFGEASAQFGQVSWITHEPQIYAFLIQGLGIVADVVATLTGARLGQRKHTRY
jgi:heme/copper-type cytochrome/quinol oxidase subunit 1